MSSHGSHNVTRWQWDGRKGLIWMEEESPERPIIVGREGQPQATVPSICSLSAVFLSCSFPAYSVFSLSPFYLYINLVREDPRHLESVTAEWKFDPQFL